jgi:predicted naringenin-chalcone synthase
MILEQVVISLATANPDRYVTGREVYDFLDSSYKLEPAEKELYRKLLEDGPINGRYVAIHHDRYDAELNQDVLTELFMQAAKEIACRAAGKAIGEAACRPVDIGAVVVNTCTGYLCPGLTSYVAEELELQSSTKVFDLMGMGCGGAIPNLEFSTAMGAADGDKMVLSIAVEVCSATLFRAPEPGIVVSNSIFADGASAAIVGMQKPGDGKGLFRFVDFASGVFPEYREQLRYKTEQGKLRNVLTRRVPVIGAKTAAEVVGRLLKKNSLQIKDINFWAVHPGGTEVLKQIGERLGISADALKFSYEIFRNFGNMSSPSVMFVLKAILDKAAPKAGQKGLILSFGAGFSAHAALINFL